MKKSDSFTDELKFMGPNSERWLALKYEGDDKTQQDETKEAQEYLKNTLLNSLQMQNIVVLAGSGTSMGPVGGPSMKDLWDFAIGKPPSIEAKTTSQKINYDLEIQNIEEFLSKSEAYLKVHDDPKVKDFFNSAKGTILEKCTNFLNADKLEAHKTFIHRLSRRRVRDPRLKVFTSNYDLCFERAASALGRVVIDGFSFTPPRRYDPKYFGYDIIRRPRVGEDQGNYLEGVFLLYKLHGSVNWARSDNDSIFEKENPLPEEACLIYPVGGKYHQSFLQPHLEAMAQYLAALREPNTCLIVIGFGFNDDHLSEPLLSAIRSNPHLRFILANRSLMKKEANGPAGNRYWQEIFRLARDGEDIWLINATFQDFVKLIPDLKSLTPADRLMKTIQSVGEN